MSPAVLTTPQLAAELGITAKTILTRLNRDGNYCGVVPINVGIGTKAPRALRWAVVDLRKARLIA